MRKPLTSARPHSGAVEQQGRSIFRGWFVVLGAFFVTFAGFGGAYTFSAFVESLETAFHASRGSVSLVFSLAGFLYFALGIISGPLADRWGSRKMAILGMVIIGVGLVLAGLATTLTQVYLAYGLGIGFGVGLSYVPVVGAVQRWFVKKRGFASGLAVSGIGVGTLVMPPLASHLIGTIGWREAYIAIGIVSAVVGIGAALLVANDPHDHGLYPDGLPGEVEDPGIRSSGVSISAAVTSMRFVGLYLACLVGSFGLFVPFVHLVPFAQDQGISQSSAVVLLGVVGIGSTVGRFFLGVLADRMGRLLAVLATFVGIGLSMVLWHFSTNIWLLGLFAFMFGTFYGGFVALLPTVVMDDFGSRNVSGLIGILYTSVAVGTLFGPSVAGYAFDLTHSYDLPILASAITSMAAACILAATARTTIPKHQEELA